MLLELFVVGCVLFRSKRYYFLAIIIIIRV